MNAVSKVELNGKTLDEDRAVTAEFTNPGVAATSVINGAVTLKDTTKARNYSLVSGVAFSTCGIVTPKLFLPCRIKGAENLSKQLPSIEDIQKRISKG